jgi:hypothetical protein
VTAGTSARRARAIVPLPLPHHQLGSRRLSGVAAELGRAAVTGIGPLAWVLMIDSLLSAALLLWRAARRWVVPRIA